MWSFVFCLQCLLAFCLSDSTSGRPCAIPPRSASSLPLLEQEKCGFFLSAPSGYRCTIMGVDYSCDDGRWLSNSPDDEIYELLQVETTNEETPIKIGQAVKSALPKQSVAKPSSATKTKVKDAGVKIKAGGLKPKEGGSQGKEEGSKVKEGGVKAKEGGVKVKDGAKAKDIPKAKAPKQFVKKVPKPAPVLSPTQTPAPSTAPTLAPTLAPAVPATTPAPLATLPANACTVCAPPTCLCVSDSVDAPVCVVATGACAGHKCTSDGDCTAAQVCIKCNGGGVLKCADTC